ncbi:MAG: hypothetical protein ACRDRZ_10635 [Pseudonocardiaceae bacterium]
MSQSPQSHAVSVMAGEAACLVVSEHPAVLDWITVYLGSWWTVTPAEATPGGSGHAVLRCRLDPQAHWQARAAVHDQPHRVVEFARKPVQVVDHLAGVCAVDVEEQVAYHATSGGREVTLVAADSLGLCLAAARIARELIRVQLEAAGWVILHASCAVRGGQAILALGGKGAGKTTTALLLAAEGLTLLANDRVFLHPDTLALLPWPSAAALGLGLLRGHGLLDGVRARLVAGEQLHPTVDPRVTAAIRHGHDTALVDDRGRELKPQFFPHQLVDWLGLRLARCAVAGRLLFPRVSPTTQPALRPTEQTLAGPDFFDPDSDDRYPDILRLARTSPDRRRELWTQAGRHIATLPRSSVALNHDTAAARRLLTPLINR